MSLFEPKTRKKLNYAFFWINLLMAFFLAYNGSFLCILNLIVSFFSWCAYKFQDNLEEQLKKR
jgi:hypothetical protein